jgi:hypothetical protein
MQAAGGILCFIAVVGVFVCWLVGMINMFRAVCYCKEGVPLFRHWYGSPFNILFRPDDLTDQGLAARRWFFRGFAGFILCVLAAVAIASLTGAGHS